MPLDPPPRSLSVRLFGELELRLGDEPLPRLESARARSLLAFLLLNRGAPQARQRLSFTLWPDSTEPQARTNLRHLIHTLRQASPDLDQYLEVTAQTISWRSDPADWVDVAAFEAAQASADEPAISSRHQLQALRDSIDIYRGDLLDGCYDEWVLDLREHFRDQYLVQLQRLADALADDGENAEAIRVGRELLRCDPLREGTYRFLMRAHVAAGDRAGAVRVYHECVSMLHRELGVEPSSDTADTYAALTEARPGTSTTERLPRAIGSRLVGRETEWQLLTDCWHEAEQGHPHLVIVTGEPGKS
jgi:DNA-binding SARP family transcriptional activator